MNNETPPQAPSGSSTAFINPYRPGKRKKTGVRCAYVAKYNTERLQAGERCKETTADGRSYCSKHRTCYEARMQDNMLNVSETPPRPNIGRTSVSPVNVKPCSLGKRVTCPKCFALMFDFEKAARSRQDEPVFNLCCNGGRLADIPLYPALPIELQALMNSQTPDAAYFRHNIRAFNTLLSFASVNADSNPQLPSRNQNVFTYSISADVNHIISDVSLNPATARFGGIYFFEPTQQLDIRRTIMPDVLRNAQDTVERLQAMVMRVNPFAIQYRNMSSILQQSPRTHFYLHMTLSEAANSAAQDDVAALVQEYSSIADKHILLRLVNNGPIRYKIVKPTSEFCDPLCYPLLLPFGTSGWTPEMARERHGGGRPVSVAEFYRYISRIKRCLAIMKLSL
jgi:hypothetical protein